MGGMTKEQARDMLKRLAKMTSAQIAKIEGI
jgi:hypothetical protein